MMEPGQEPFMRRMLNQPQSYPYALRIERNLHLILAMAMSVEKVEEMLIDKNKVPKRSGTIRFYPKPDLAVRRYGALLQEMLIETAVFIRGHDDFWENRGGGSWAKLLPLKCGTTEYLDGDKKVMKLGLRDACDKIIHHTNFDIGNIGEKKNPTVWLWGKLRDRKWMATIDVTEFCLIGLSYVG